MARHNLSDLVALMQGTLATFTTPSTREHLASLNAKTPLSYKTKAAQCPLFV